MKPISGKKILSAIKDKNCIILAANIRIIPGCAKGIFKAVKDMDAALLVELARTECNQHTGYTGLTPQTFSKYLQEVNDEVGHDIWALHADHIGIKTGTTEDIDDTKELIDHQIKAGYTSFAIDASHLFNFDGKTSKEELQPNIDVTIELAKYIKTKIGHDDFGLEVEVGEIGRTDESGMILTTPDQAVTYIQALTEEGINPDILAIANGSTHGNVYDKEGKLIPLETIDIELTKNVVLALKENNFNIKIAQHGITGTPIKLIKEKFPIGDIIKGNVATLYQNIVFDALKKHHPDLFKQMLDWTVENKPMPGKKAEEIMGKNGKHAVKQFFDEIYAMNDECKAEVEKICYKETVDFIDAFNAKGSAEIVRKTL
jgi:fructose-bisphosphate aldolase, class II